jgi:hypothetical protein
MTHCPLPDEPRLSPIKRGERDYEASAGINGDVPDSMEVAEYGCPKVGHRTHLPRGLRLDTRLPVRAVVDPCGSRPGRSPLDRRLDAGI